MRNIRTDLALEAREAVKGAPDGVLIEEEEVEEGIKITRVRIVSEAGAHTLGKPRGSYITLEAENIANMEPRRRKTLAGLAAFELFALTGEIEGTVLIVGLGNRAVTPDSIGPKACESVFITRHIKEHIPDAIDDRAACVCAVSPGVLGTTGIETGEIIKGVIERVKPALIIAIDALAARSVARIGASVQISDAGVVPGSGVGNARAELSMRSVGVPVLVLGIPMVANANTIAEDLIEQALGNCDEEDVAQLVSAVMANESENLVVASKDVDILSERCAALLADIINHALNGALSEEEIEQYIG